MNHRERIHAALRGEALDQVPVALWRHFPKDDQRPASFAARVVEFQKKYDFDLVKVTPAGGYPAEMYGAVLHDAENREGTRAYDSRPVSTAGDWEKIQPLDENNPVFAREIKSLQLIRQQLGGDIPILQTIFGPLNSAHNIAGSRLFEDLHAHPERVEPALRAIAETTARLATASLRAGADAIFFAEQMATPRYLSLDEFEKYGEPYDRQVLDAIRGAKADFILLHIHGLDVYFERLAEWDVEAVNWHDRRTPPSLKQARDILRSIPGGHHLGRQNVKALVGGLEEWTTLAGPSPDAVIAQARDALTQTDGRGFILGAGCVMLVDTPEENIRAAIRAVRG